MKNKKENNIIWDFVEKHTNLVYLTIVTVLAFVIRLFVIERISGDYMTFLSSWFNTLKINGGLPGLSLNVGNYMPIYMTILALLTYLPIRSIITIKIVSIVFDFVGAFAIMRIVSELLGNKKNKERISMLVYTIYLFLPTVFFNSAYWAQSDSIYTAFVLLSVLYLMRSKYKTAMIFWAIAFAFKFQAIFIFPLYVLIYISDYKKFKFRYFFIIPIVIFVLSIPKVIYSHDLLAGFRIYFEQGGTYSSYLSLNFPNVYSLFFKPTEYNLILTPFIDFGTAAIIFTFIILVIIAYLVYLKKIKFDKKAIIEFGLYSILIMTFFLPQMHERYLFMGDVLALAYVVINIKKFYVPLIIEAVSLYGYIFYLFRGDAFSISTIGVLYLILMIVFTKDMCQKYFLKE